MGSISISGIRDRNPHIRPNAPNVIPTFTSQKTNQAIEIIQRTQNETIIGLVLRLWENLTRSNEGRTAINMRQQINTVYLILPIFWQERKINSKTKIKYSHAIEQKGEQAKYQGHFSHVH